MQKTMKKTLAIILAILMIVTTIPMAFAADVVASGNCGANGENVKWTLDSDGTLTISGTGNMADYPQYSKVPWINYRSDVKKLIIEDGVTSIGENTGYVLTFTTSIYIGKDVKSISGRARDALDSARLETITVSEDNEYYKTVDNVLFSKDGKDLLYAANKGLSDTYTVPDGVVKINEQAFDFLPNLEKVVLSDSVEEIGDWNFYECKSLKILDVGMAKISSFSNEIFTGSEHPVEVIADKDNEYVSVVNGSLFSKIDGTLFYAYVTDNKCVVPYGVKIIPESTIFVEDGSVVVPDTVETIERYGIDGYDSVVHYLGTESQFQEIYEGDMSEFDFEWLNMSMHYCVQQSNIPASCTDDGVTEWYCSTCDETIKYVTGYAFGHDIVEVEAKAPTCTQVGNEAYEYCTACDYTTYVEIPALTHTDANCDYKCDYNCGYVYETLDFSDAKVLTAVDGALYIDGVEAETNSSKSQSRIYEGKYILGGDIETSRYIWIFGDTTLDLNGYTWNLTDKYINVNVPLSIYDTSEAETGKITSGSSNQTININNVAAGFNLYGGTIENTSISGRCALDVSWADVNLYAGKIKSNSQAICFTPGHEITINIDDTVIESGDDYADVLVALGTNDIAKGDIDVTDYKGDSLTAKVTVTSTLGKITVFKGIKNTQEAEKYQIIDVVCSESFDLFWKKTEYDEATGEKSIYTANNAFTQQPSAENNFTVDFNNPDATSQWYEVEEEKLGAYIVEKHGPLFSHDFKAGDILKVSTDSELRHLVIETGTIDTDYAYIRLDEYEKTATITFDADTTVDLFVAIVNADNPVEVNFTVFKETKLDGETEKTLQNAECGKSYYCKATVGNAVYVSDSFAGHGGEATCVAKAVCETCGVEFGNIDTNNHKDTLVQVDAKAPTCTEIGWDAYEYCTACDYTTYEELPVDPDAHTPLEAVTENEVAPKCDVAGSYDLVVYCDDCGAELDRDTKTVDALKHSFTKYKVTEEAKCGVAGKEVAVCDNGCGETDEKAIEALKHDIVIDEAVAPKCGETGLTQGEHCTRCDYKVEQEIVPALEHKDADGDYKCDNGCGHEFEKPAPEEPTPDTPDEPTDSTCDHLCHKSGILGFFWKIVKFFSKLFKLNPVCECGAAHY